MEVPWPIMLGAIGGLVVASLLLAWGVRLLARRDRDEEEASRMGVDIVAALAREPRLREAAILPVATIPLEGRPSLEVTGRVPSASAHDLALDIITRELTRVRPGMRVIDRLEVVSAATQRRRA